MNSSIKSALRRLGWGLVFPLIDFRLVFFDVFPDVIGYILISAALGQLGEGNDVFKQAKWLAVVLIFLSLPQVIMNMSIDINQFSTATYGMHAYVQVSTILHALLIYHIFKGLHTFAKPMATPELLDSIVSRRKMYMTLFAIQLIFYPFLLNIEESWIMLLLLIWVIIFIAELLLVRLPFRLSRIENIAKIHAKGETFE